MPYFTSPNAFLYVLSVLFLGTATFSPEDTFAQSSHSTAIAHAHNDYEHERPLLDALKAGFTSFEADVYLIDGKLLVAHDQQDTTPDRSLESLYLDPLRRHCSDRTKDSTHKTLWLMIDVKSASVATFQKIHAALKQYPDLFAQQSTTPAQHPEPPGPPVRIVISGNRAKDEILKSQPRLAGIDGRLSDMESDLSSDAMPWISDNWRSHFRWRGESTLPDQEREKLQDYVKQAHNKGRLLRFWATPDSPAVWDALLDAQVDLINADDLLGLQKHLKTRSQQAR